jgi:transcriptional regulator with XRE-family HTH domain
MKITQCRMARAALNWSMSELAKASGVGTRTVAKFEGGGNVTPGIVETLRATFVQAGIGFTNGGKRAGVTYELRD